MLYNDDLDIEVPFNEGIFEPHTPRDLSEIDFYDLSNFWSTIGKSEAEQLKKKYPFRRGYVLNLPSLDHQAHLSPKGLVAIYTGKLEAELKMLTSWFFWDNVRY